MTPEQTAELESRTWERPKPYSDEWFEEAEAFHSKRARNLQKLSSFGLMREGGKFIHQDRLDAELALAEQARTRTLKSVLVQLREMT
jgi:hypothetical protein